ncbi:MAG: M56 family metallopeptidase, partial [Oscillospiraceae bacterium]|nr:M56 family metallopeptidase [Oscillospiraceae bacterium]
MGAFFEALVNHSDRIFSALLNRAVAATLLILAVCVYRALSPKAPKWTRLFLWALAGLRLCLPFSIRSAWSLVPSEKILDYETAQYAAKPEITSGIAALNRAVNPAFGESFAATPAASANPLQIWMHLAGIVWAIGVLALLLLALVSVRRIRRRVRASIELQKGVRLCDAIDTPFLLGLFRPTVYLPSQLSQQERDVVLAHEAAHKTHGDCVWKGLGYGILCVYWFYPPVWLGYALFC